MTPRFTIIQGGLSKTASRVDAAAGRPALTLVANAPAAAGGPAGGWRIVLRRPSDLRQAEIEEWRALAARTTNLDPFADPDFVATAALHEPRGPSRGVAFALAFQANVDGIERLRGVVPLALSQQIWGGPVVRVWQAPLSPRPVEPVFDDGAGGAAIAAVLRHLAEKSPRVSLRLSCVAAAGGLLTDLRGDKSFRVNDRPTGRSIPEGQFVSVGARETVSRVERITAPDRIRDAVERFLLTDARCACRSLLPDPAAASTVRVVSRLFARRGLIEVELHSGIGNTVAGAIRLGREGERVLWRSVGLDEVLPPPTPTADVEVALAGVMERPDAVRAVIS